MVTFGDLFYGGVAMMTITILAALFWFGGLAARRNASRPLVPGSVRAVTTVRRSAHDGREFMKH